jgi:hypothetical protein
MTVPRTCLRLALAATLLVGFPGGAVAHEIPADVTVVAFVHPDGQRLRILVRVPFESIRDVELPLVDFTYLDLRGVEPLLSDAARLWIADYIEVREGDTTLADPRIVATRISLPTDASFTGYERALAHMSADPLPPQLLLPWQQAMLDVLLEYDIASEDSEFALHPALAHLGVRTQTVLRFVLPDGRERVFRYEGDPGMVRLDPRWHHAAYRFVQLGFFHILEGLDHLLFVFCLVIPFRKVRGLVAIVTAFTVAHSITLIAAAFGYAPGTLWFPPLIETLIAASIVYMALENIVGAKLQRRWLIAFAFGLVHGFGFSFLLRESLQFAGSHLITSLLAFNLGVELGQVAVLLVAIPVLNWLFSTINERIGIIVLSALVAHTAWHWMGDRFADLRQFEFTLPALDAAFMAGLLRAVMLLLIAGGAAWLLTGLMRRLTSSAALPTAGRTDSLDVTT